MDRFIWSKSTTYFGYVGQAGSVLAFLIPGVVVGLFGLGFSLAAMLSPVKQLFYPGFIQLGMGLTFLATAGFLRRKYRNTPQSEVKLSGDARALIHRLATHIGWTDWNAQHRQHGFRLEVLGLSIGGPKTSADKLKPFTFGLLERAAAHYNKIQGLLTTKDSKSATILQKHEPGIKAAADEAMIVSLNQAALMEKFPESSENCRTVMEARIRDLEELSSRLARIIHGQMTVTEALSSGSVMGSVLEQLRLDEAARTELNRAEDEINQSLRQQLGQE